MAKQSKKKGYSLEKHDQLIKSKVIPALRQVSRFWPTKKEALLKRRKQVQVGEFANGKPKMLWMCPCDTCGQLKPQNEIEYDHIDPVIPLTGFDSWDGVIRRMLCKVEGWATLCSLCHEKRTAEQTAIRKLNSTLK